MSRAIVLKSTIDTIGHIWASLDRQREWQERRYHYYWRDSATLSLDYVRHELLHLNHYLAQIDCKGSQEVREGELRTDWLFYENEHEVIPVYDEALAVVSRRLIAPLSDISNVLAFIGIPKTGTGLDVENHDGKGYHFHYGKIKRDALKRYDVLLTFDKQDADSDKMPIANIPIHIESHAAGKCIHIDASTIGHNRRLPIYLLCVKAMESRGLENFLLPSANSWQFYPAA